MPLSEIPTLGQLQEFRKSGKCSGLRTAKADIMKSAIVGLKLNGEFVGFGTVEQPSPAELEKFRKETVSKSVTESELNEVFDDSPLLPDYRNEKLQSVELQKSAFSDTQENLEGIFPTWLQSN